MGSEKLWKLEDVPCWECGEKRLTRIVCSIAPLEILYGCYNCGSHKPEEWFKEYAEGWYWKDLFKDFKKLKGD